MVRAVLGSARASVAFFLAHCRQELQGARQGLGRRIQRGTFAQKSSNCAKGSPQSRLLLDEDERVARQPERHCIDGEAPIPEEQRLAENDGDC